MFAKVAALGAGVAVVGTSVGAVVTEGFGYWKSISWKPLSQDSSFKTDNGVHTNYQGKFGDKHKNFLTGTDSSNKNWWDKQYSDLFTGENNSKPTTGKFKDVDKGFKGNTSLKHICDEAYKADSGNITEEGKGSDFKEEEVWKFCSILGGLPKTLTTGDERYRGKLISSSAITSTLVDYEGNDEFWRIRNSEFYGEPGFEKLTVDAQYTYFEGKKSLESKTNIRDICKEAYDTPNPPTPTDSITPADTEIQKYCSFPIP